MRFRTAGIWSIVLVGGMFVFPAVVMTVFLPGFSRSASSLPFYERVLLGVTVFFLTFRFFLAIPIVAVLFTIAGFTHALPARKR